ncbi:MAG TPA: alkaline phosphatase family protein [Candidatus Angelobacter sp.]|nr:alkaline phosphatase family protein [Candidatus Angelobacter sp.]
MGPLRSKILPVNLVFLVLMCIAFAGCGSINNGGGGGGGGNPTPQAVIAINVQPANIVQGQAATISWQVTKANTFSISPSVLPAGQTYPMTGSAQVSPSQTTTYTATAVDANGLSTTTTVTVTVAAAGSTPTISLSITPAVVASGQAATISWQSANATSVAITPSILGDDQTSVDLSGSAQIIPTANATYTATATGAGGATAKATATVNILNVSLTVTPATIGPGQSATLSWNTNIASGTTLSIDQGINGVNGPSGSLTVSPAATTTYTITATNGAAVATAQATVNAPLSVTLTASPANITPGQQATLSWNSRGASTLSIDNGVGTVAAPAGNQVVSPSQATTYTITATDSGGHTTTASTTVTVSTGSGLGTIKHIIFMLQENRSFDSYFGQLQAYASQKVPGYQINSGYDPNRLMPLISGALAHPFHEPTVRTENLTPAWNESHFDVHQQSDGTFKMDQFALTTHSVTHNFDPDGLRAFGFYDQTDLPYYYELATQFATSDAFHSSLLSNTFPNRSYMFCATSQGRIRPDPAGHAPWTCPTIFSSMQNAGVKWAYYYTDGIFLFNFQDWSNPAIQSKTSRMQNLLNILASPTADQDLASVVFIDSASGKSGLDEHPDNNIQTGSAFVKSIIDALMASPAWHDSVFILGFDEGGGLYDHVPPFTVVAPDATPPALQPGDLPGDFTLSGFRVPLVVISPWVKPHFVSHTNRELTSILKLIETRFGLTPLTARDAAADDMTEFFDFIDPPTFLTPPPLPAQPTTGVNDPTKEAPPQ